MTEAAVESPCPICGSRSGTRRFAMPVEGTEGGVDADRFRPSDLGFGQPPGDVLWCGHCRHGYAADVPTDDVLSSAYADAADPVSLREETGQVTTGERTLELAERWVAPGALLDVGCWTGSLLVSGRRRGWTVSGVEPSRWASARARARGVDVVTADFEDDVTPTGPFRLLTMCDVLEHLADPGRALDRAADLLEPDGALLLTVPDAGSTLARVLGRRWWSVLPMHVQYFTRSSMEALLQRHGFRVAVIESHAKVFSVEYYIERLAGYVPSLARLLGTAARRARLADRLIAPDFRDRMVVVAIRQPVADAAGAADDPGDLEAATGRSPA